MVAVVGSKSSDVSNLNSSGNEASVYKRSILRTIRGYVSSLMGEPCISCTTFNILAPIYKRPDPQNQNIRESDFRESWFIRNQSILDWLLCERSSIICLQEFWVGNEELVDMYQQRLGDAGYKTFKLARTNNRGDGLLTALHENYFSVLNYTELLFNDFGDRVAQLLHVQSVVPFLANREQEILIVNTHLLFPHDSSLSIVRLHQVYKILQSVEEYQTENKLNHVPVILCGDWNGSKRGHVYKFLRSQGFVSSYDIAHQYTDGDADCHKWVSHRNHRGNICGVDFIWLRNPNQSRKPLKTSWAQSVFGIMKCQLQKTSLSENDAFASLKADNDDDAITYSAFCESLHKANLVGGYGLSPRETKDLWTQADVDGDGVVNYEEFKRMWNMTCLEQIEDSCSDSTEDLEEGIEEEVVGFEVKNAFLFPREVEKGFWPENYSLSDHARLRVLFSPVKMQGSLVQTSKRSVINYMKEKQVKISQTVQHLKSVILENFDNKQDVLDLYSAALFLKCDTLTAFPVLNVHGYIILLNVNPLKVSRYLVALGRICLPRECSQRCLLYSTSDVVKREETKNSW